MDKWKGKWSQIIDSVGTKAGVDMWQKADGNSWKHCKSVIQADAQVVIKSVGSYLSKYLSKQAPSPSKGTSGAFLGPVRWWGVSRPLLKRCRELSCEFTLEWIEFGNRERMWDKVREVFSGMADGFHSYTDRLGFARIAVAFGEDAGGLFNDAWRDMRPRWIGVSYGPSPNHRVESMVPELASVA
jgi:hypothetical protein